jgi:hypothetical protein
MTVNPLYPTVLPTLNLDFANSKRLDPRITFTRASVATYVGADGLIKTAASGEPRFDHNPTTGECLGLLVEEARANACLRSEEIDNAVWNATAASSTVVANAITAPNGLQTADKLVASATTGTGTAQSGISVSGSFVISFFAKAAETTNVLARENTISGVQATFNLSTGTVGQTNATASIVSYGNGWYRCFLLGTGTGTVAISIGDVGSPTITWPNPQNRVIGNGIYLWGAQVENGAFPTSYIPTSGSTVTRTADVASMTGTNFSSWWNGNKEGTLFFNHDLNPETQVASTSNSMIVAFADSLTAYSNAIGYWGSGGQRYLTTNAYSTASETYNASSFSSWGVTLSNPGYDKYALAYKPGTGLSRAAINGVLLPSAKDMPSAYIPTGFYFGGTHTQRIARLAYYPARLPDAQLQALTAT